MSTKSLNSSGEIEHLLDDFLALRNFRNVRDVRGRIDNLLAVLFRLLVYLVQLLVELHGVHR